jgi:hypothetical protein
MIYFSVIVSDDTISGIRDAALHLRTDHRNIMIPLIVEHFLLSKQKKKGTAKGKEKESEGTFKLDLASKVWNKLAVKMWGSEFEVFANKAHIVEVTHGFTSKSTY